MISDVQNYNKLGKEQKKIAKIFHNNTFAIDFTVIVYAFPSILRMSAAAMLSHLLEYLSMELFLRLDDAQHLLGRQNGHKSRMIFLLQLFHPNIELVQSANRLGTSLIVTRRELPELAHLAKHHALLLHHLPIDVKKLCRLRWQQTGVSGDVFFQVSLKLGRIEWWAFLGRLGIHTHHHHHYQ